LPLAVLIVGRSNSGKTTLVENLVREFKRRDRRLATIKHSVHDLDLDSPGKDSWRYTQAGSDTVIVSSPRQLGLIRPTARDSTIEELLQLIGQDVDLVLVEGFKNSGSQFPRIEVHREEVGALLCRSEQLMAVVTDQPLDIAIPQFSPDDVGPLADMIEELLIVHRQRDEIGLAINGTPVELDAAAESTLHQGLVKLMSELDGVAEMKTLDVSLRRGEE